MDMRKDNNVVTIKEGKVCERFFYVFLPDVRDCIVSFDDCNDISEGDDSVAGISWGKSASVGCDDGSVVMPLAFIRLLASAIANPLLDSPSCVTHFFP